MKTIFFFGILYGHKAYAQTQTRLNKEVALLLNVKREINYRIIILKNTFKEDSFVSWSIFFSKPPCSPLKASNSVFSFSTSLICAFRSLFYLLHFKSFFFLFYLPVLLVFLLFRLVNHHKQVGQANKVERATTIATILDHIIKY